MSEGPIAVIAQFEFYPEKIDLAKQIIEKIIEPTRQEPGCLYYAFLQDAESSHRFMMMERWASKAEWEAHLQSDHIEKAKAEDQLPSCLSKPMQVRWYHAVDF